MGNFRIPTQAKTGLEWGTRQGSETEIRDPQGNRLLMHRDPQRNLEEIETPHGRFIKFTYDGESRITHAEDDRGNWTNYQYNSDGMLTDAVSSSGRERHYSYDGHEMAEVRDKAGKVLVHNWYDGERVTRQQFANGDVYSYDYRPSANRKYAEVVTVTMPDGSKQVVHPSASVSGYLRRIPVQR